MGKLGNGKASSTSIKHLFRSRLLLLRLGDADAVDQTDG